MFTKSQMNEISKYQRLGSPEKSRDANMMQSMQQETVISKNSSIQFNLKLRGSSFQELNRPSKSNEVSSKHSTHNSKLVGINSQGPKTAQLSTQSAKSKDAQPIIGEVDETFIDTFEDKDESGSLRETPQLSNMASQQIRSGGLIQLAEGNKNEGQFSKMLEGSIKEAPDSALSRSFA